MKWCAISDIHGHYQQLIELEEMIFARYPHIQIIYNGDYVDRGPQSHEVLYHLMKRKEQGHVVIKGNHDVFFEEFLLGEYYEYPLQFGRTTIQSFFPEATNFHDYVEVMRIRRNFNIEHPEILPFLSSLPYHHQIDDTVFIHGGFNPFKDSYQQSTDTEMTMPAWKMAQFAGTFPHQHFIFGHVFASNYNPPLSFPYTKKNMTFIDGGLYDKGTLNAYFEDGSYLSVQ